VLAAHDAARLRRIGAATLALLLIGSTVALTPAVASAEPVPASAEPAQAEPDAPAPDPAPDDASGDASGDVSGDASDGDGDGGPSAITPLAIVLPGTAAPGVSGAIWIDLNGDGAETDDVLPGFGHPAIVDAGVEVGRGGVAVELISGGAVVDSTVTAADGTYSFPAAADGTYIVRALAPAHFGWTVSGLDSDVTPGAASPPALLPATASATVAGGLSEPVNGGLLPLPRITLDYYDGAPAIGGSQSYLTGVSASPATPPADPNGNCPSAVLVAGADCSTTDDIVATNDLTTLTYSPGSVIVVGASATTVTVTNTYPTVPATAPSSPAPAPADSVTLPLARTGADVVRLGVLGALLAVAGVALALRARPRRS
jgi:hypothetical protein